jgi:hypothetical protein
MAHPVSSRVNEFLNSLSGRWELVSLQAECKTAPEYPTNRATGPPVRLRRSQAGMQSLCAALTKTLRVTPPAMGAGIASHPWTLLEPIAA